MRFKKGGRVVFQNGNGLKGGGYEGKGIVRYVREQDGGDLLFLEDHAGIGSGIKVWAKDCEKSGAVFPRAERE